MATLSIKLNLLPGITRDINITLEDLLESFNLSWSMEDRLKLIMGLDLGNSDNAENIRAVAKVISSIEVGDLSVNQLLILDSAIKDFKSKIDNKKQEIVESNEQ